MRPLIALWHSTIGKKAVMALTGLIGIGFLISHVASNLQVFTAPAKLDEYAVFLRSFGPLLWVARAVLIAAIVLHVVAAVQLSARSRAARPEGYRKFAPQAATPASRTMLVGGIVLLVFVVWHILDMTLGWVTPGFVHLVPSGNIILSLGRWPVALFYVVAMIALGLHLYHGAWAFMRTLGLSRPSLEPLKHGISALIAIAVAAGFAAIPLAVLFGFLP
jgi:succinate dehydrogenase / fumarate reductase, cytochrome b subunit